MTWNNSTDSVLAKCKCCMLSINKDFTMVQRKQRVGSPRLPVGKNGLLSFLYPICLGINSFCFHFKAQLKYPVFSQKRGDQDEENPLTYQFILFSF